MLRNYVRAAYIRGALGILIALMTLICGCRHSEDHRARRESMVRYQIAARGIQDPRILAAMRRVPRHEFVPQNLRPAAYDDRALPIGEEQTISQPYIVALMSEVLELTPDDRVLEIGTGSGYQAAVLAELTDQIYSIEIIESLGLRAEQTLRRLGYDQIRLKIGDGYLGWPEHAPFDAIIVTCAPEQIPPPLVDQLAEGGRMVIPVGPRHAQELVLVVKEQGRIRQQEIIPVLFVPMTGDHVSPP